MNYITFDIETYSPADLKKIDTKEFRVSVAGAYVSWLDEYIAFVEEDVVDLIDLMTKAELVVGFNHKWFDLPVMQKYTSLNLNELPSYDILLEVEKKVGFKIKLDDLCRANFGGDVKTDSYSTYKNYHKEKKWFELIDYCLNDVRLTEKLFRMCLEKKQLSYFDLHQKKEILLDTPRPGILISALQMNSIF